MAKKVWTCFAQLALPSGKLSLSDTSYFFDSYLVVDLEPGEYEVSVLLDEDRDVCRLRVASGGFAISKGRLGSLVVDFGQVGVCDRVDTERAFLAGGNDGMTNYFAALRSDPFGVVDLEWVRMPFAKAGLGDGEYWVFELLSQDGIRVGVEVDFDIGD